uniref:Uncharacterized protein n=1 Tax=Triticum urartu TaxID=4572 RepID=A0A8R7UJE0_TRIUA
MPPLSWLWPRSRTSRPRRLESSAGICPARKLLDMSRLLRRVRLPMTGGTAPEMFMSPRERPMTCCRLQSQATPVRPQTSPLDSFQSARGDGDSKVSERFNARSVAFSCRSTCRRRCCCRTIVPARLSPAAAAMAWKSMRWRWRWRRRRMAARLTAMGAALMF